MLDHINLLKKIRKYHFPTLLAAIVLTISPVDVCSQEVALKTNILYDLTTTPNIGIEIGLGGRSTFNLTYGLNPWKFKSDSHGDRYVKHWVVMPEYRWWPCTRMYGHFIGVHALGGQLNTANVDLPVPGMFFNGLNLRNAVKDGRYQGWYTGGGLTYGYQFAMSRHWNLETEIGIGYIHMWYDQYPCGECGVRIRKGGINYAGLTKLGVSLMYIF